MLWNLYGPKAEQYFRSWNTCVKLSWNVPRSTHTYFVENLLAADFTTLRTQILSRYVKFFQKLLSSKSLEVKILAELVGKDATSTTGNNLARIRLESGLDPWVVSGSTMSAKLPPAEVPDQDEWRLPLLEKYIRKRHEAESNLEDTDQLNELINSLCSN